MSHRKRGMALVALIAAIAAGLTITPALSSNTTTVAACTEDWKWESC